MKRCFKCPYWFHSVTLGSPDVPVWHCRQGFEPSEDCRAQADYNKICKRDYYRRHPEELQLSFKFDS